MGMINLACLLLLLLFLNGVAGDPAPEDALTHRLFDDYNSLVSPYMKRSSWLHFKNIEQFEHLSDLSTQVQVSISLSMAIIAGMVNEMLTDL